MKNELDPVFNNPNKLRVVSLLSSSQQASFTYIKEALEISDSSLSKLMNALSEKQYVKVNRAHKGRGAQTYYQATRQGRKALRDHVQALREILEAANEPL